VARPCARSVYGAAMSSPGLKPSGKPKEADTWPPVPDLFDVITYFRARGDSYNLIASVGFWLEDQPAKAISARHLKRWYEAELARRAADKSSVG